MARTQRKRRSSPALPGAQYTDKRAFARLVAQYGRDMRNFARYRAGNDADADDVYQDALISAMRYIGSFRGDAPLKHWLLKLVTCACYQRRRSLKNDPSRHVPIDVLVQASSPQLVSQEPTADARAIEGENAGFLNEALEAIPPEDRRLLELHHVGEVSLREIARDMEISIPCAKTRLYRARAAVRRHMDTRMGVAA